MSGRRGYLGWLIAQMDKMDDEELAGHIDADKYAAADNYRRFAAALKLVVAENEALKESINVETDMCELLANQLVSARVRYPHLVPAHNLPNRAEDIWLVWASHEAKP